MPQFKPSWTKRKKGGHRSAAKVQNVQTGAAVSTEVAEDLGCQSTAENLVCQATAEDLVCQAIAEEDDPVALSTVSLPNVQPVGKLYSETCCNLCIAYPFPSYMNIIICLLVYIHFV